MLQKQKESILSLVKAKDISKDFSQQYLLPYIDFFDLGDNFTDFQCERDEGKALYVSFIESLTCTDKYAQIFVEIYGVEEDGDDFWIYADTLIIFSELSFSEIKQIFSKSKDVFPSEIGEIKEINEKDILIYKDGTQHLLVASCSRAYNFYYCWWD